MTEAEAAILARGLAEGATPEQVVAADEVCKEKCKICFDGENCDHECAREKCLKKGVVGQ